MLIVKVKVKGALNIIDRGATISEKLMGKNGTIKLCESYVTSVNL